MTPAEAEVEQQRLIAEYLSRPELWPAESKRRYLISQARKRRFGQGGNGPGGYSKSISYAELQARLKAAAA